MGAPSPSERGTQHLKGLRLFAAGALVALACESAPPKSPNTQATIEVAVRATTTALASKPKDPPTPVSAPTQRPTERPPVVQRPPPPTATVPQVERVSDADFLTFRSPYLRYQMLYPRTWTTTSRNQPFPVDEFGGEGVGVLVRADPTGTTSIDGHRVNVQEQRYGVTITSEKRRKIGPYDAIHFVGRQIIDTSVGPLHYEEVIFVARERGWRIFIAAKPQLAAKSAAQFQKMLDSFRLL